MHCEVAGYFHLIDLDVGRSLSVPPISESCNFKCGFKWQTRQQRGWLIITGLNCQQSRLFPLLSGDQNRHKGEGEEVTFSTDPLFPSREQNVRS
jgi:hypothetical protein